MGLHFIPAENRMEDYLDWLDSRGRALIERVENAGVRVEHELHAFSYLLPRELFSEKPRQSAQRAGNFPAGRRFVAVYHVANGLV